MDSSTEEKILDAQIRLYGSDAVDSWKAANELAEIGLPALPTLIGALNEPRAASHVHENVLHAIERFGSLGMPALPHVLRFLNPEIGGDACSWEAISVLQAIGDAAVSPLVERMRKAGALEWRACKQAMINLPTRSVVPALISAVQEPDGELRIRACEILEKKNYWLEDQLLEPAVQVLIELLGKSDSHVRAAAARALGQIGEAAFRALMPLLKSEDAVVRAASVSAISECAARHPILSRSDGGDVFSLLPDMLDDGDSSVRIAAVVGIHRAATAIAHRQLSDELAVENSDKRLLAAPCFRAEVLRPSVRDILTLEEDVARAKDLRLRRQSAATLLACGEAHSDGVLETLSKALADPEDPCRDQYLLAAQRGGYWSAPLLPVIAQYLRSDDSHCKLAIKTIVAIGVTTDEIVDRLLVCLKTARDHDVRCAAADALGDLTPQKTEVVTALVEALNVWDLGQHACQALGNMGDMAASVVPDIEAAVHLGFRVPEALARIRTPEAIAALWRLYNEGGDGYGDHVGRTEGQDLYDRAHAELRNLGEIHRDPPV